MRRGRAGSQPKRHSRTSTPARVQTRSTARWPRARPEPVISGARAWLMAADACRRGKNHEIASRTGGKFAPMTKMSETKARGSRVPRIREMIRMVFALGPRRMVHRNRGRTLGLLSLVCRCDIA